MKVKENTSRITHYFILFLIFRTINFKKLKLKYNVIYSSKNR